MEPRQGPPADAHYLARPTLLLFKYRRLVAGVVLGNQRRREELANLFQDMLLGGWLDSGAPAHADGLGQEEIEESASLEADSIHDDKLPR